MITLPPVLHRTLNVDGLDIFYREAGSPKRPTLVLLHGFPSSSHMFRNLILTLADEFHIIAPDYPGYGQSSAPSANEFPYTFDRLAEVIEAFLTKLNVTRFSLYIQDFGAPVGLRIAARNPDWISSLIVQNGNAYVEGISAAFDAFKPFWLNRTAETEVPLRGFLTLDTTQFQYTHGARNVEAISPDTWTHDQALLDRPGNHEVQLSLMHDYQNNPSQYAIWQDYFRNDQPPTLITWGRNDPFFTEEGARAYLRDLPNAELHLLDSGHFALEEDVNIVGALISEFIGKHGK
jgi:pimeloyl-ACP methyl ester carboxylesterase